MSDKKTKEALLKEINDRWARECACTLRETATQAIPGDGNAEAEIMFIGEGPGRDEDIQGKPFVGAAGKFLNELLDTVGMKRSDVYITNVVKYRPPNNRDPFPEEIEACYPWLVEQINLIGPKLIVFLGRHALERFFPEEKISRVHGKLLIRTIRGIGRRNFFALYHPAAALYNGGMRDVLKEDFKKMTHAVALIHKEQEHPENAAESISYPDKQESPPSPRAQTSGQQEKLF